MVLYNCERCGWSTKIRTHYNNHLNRKFPCKIKNPLTTNTSENKKSYINSLIFPSKTLIFPSKNPQIPSKNPQIPSFFPQNKNEGKNITKNSYICQFCQKSYSRKDNLKRHQIKCKEINNNAVQEDKNTELLKLILEKHEQEKEDWKKEREDMKKEISKLVEKVGDTYNSFNQNNIYINNLGQENLDYLSQPYLNKLLNLPFTSIPTLIKNIHFNPKHPENHNIRITNKKLPYAQIYRNNEWVVGDKKEIIENIVDNGFSIIDSFYQEKTDNLDTSKNNKYKIFQDKYVDKDKSLLKKINKDTELIMINNTK